MSGAPTWVAVGLLGGAGAVARVLVAGAVAQRLRRALPVGTFVVNVSGSLALGALAGAHVTGDALLLVGTATLGAYTTFSGWVHDSVELSLRGAALNLGGSLAVGLGAVALGHLAGAAW